MEDTLSALENYAEDGNFPEFVALFESGNYAPQDVLDAMDTAYRGTRVDPPIEGCDKIVEFLAKKGVPIPNYPFYRKRVD